MYKVPAHLLERLYKCLDVSGRNQRTVSYTEKTENQKEIRELKSILEKNYMCNGPDKNNKA